MILVDTSVWIDHFRSSDEKLAEALRAGQVLVHPFIVGELALGTLRQRDLIIEALKGLPAAVVAEPDDVLRFIDRHRLAGRGVGYVDMHLAVSVSLTPNALLWTRDRRLRQMCDDLELAA